MENEKIKSPLQSVTVWGGLLSLVPAIVELVNQAASTGALGPYGTIAVSAIGGIVTIIGRIRAKKKIG